MQMLTFLNHEPQMRKVQSVRMSLILDFPWAISYWTEGWMKRFAIAWDEVKIMFPCIFWEALSGSEGAPIASV